MTREDIVQRVNEHLDGIRTLLQEENATNLGFWGYCIDKRGEDVTDHHIVGGVQGSSKIIQLGLASIFVDDVDIFNMAKCAISAIEEVVPEYGKEDQQ